MLLLRLRDPLLLLLAAAAISAFTGDATSASIIIVMLAASVALDFFQERRAHDAVERLRATEVKAGRTTEGTFERCAIST